MKESTPPDTPSPARISMDPVESALQRPEGALRVAVVDMGTNSTRLLVADVERGSVHEIERRTR